MKLIVKFIDGTTVTGTDRSLSTEVTKHGLPAKIEVIQDNGTTITLFNSKVRVNDEYVFLHDHYLIPMFYKRLRSIGIDLSEKTLRALVLAFYDPRTTTVPFAWEVYPGGGYSQITVNENVQRVFKSIVEAGLRVYNS